MHPFLFFANGLIANLIDCPLLLQAAKACQQKLENEVSIFESMVKNEEHFGKRDINPIQYK